MKKFVLNVLAIVSVFLICGNLTAWGEETKPIFEYSFGTLTANTGTDDATGGTIYYYKVGSDNFKTINKIRTIINNRKMPVIIKILLFKKPFLFILFSKFILNISLSA